MFKDIFVRILQERNISAYKLSKDTGIAQGMISYWKTGKRIPSAESLNVLADYLDCSVDYLLGRDEKKNTPGEGGGPSETAQRFMPLVDRLTPEQQQLLLTQIQAWIGQNELLSPVAPQSSEGKVPGFDP